jgi:hypothetical protein
MKTWAISCLRASSSARSRLRPQMAARRAPTLLRNISVLSFLIYVPDRLLDLDVGEDLVDELLHSLRACSPSTGICCLPDQAHRFVQVVLDSGRNGYTGACFSERLSISTSQSAPSACDDTDLPAMPISLVVWIYSHDEDSVSPGYYGIGI